MTLEKEVKQIKMFLFDDTIFTFISPLGFDFTLSS